jgi:hypothetical protein
LAQKIIGRVVGYYLVGDFYGEAGSNGKGILSRNTIMSRFSGRFLSYR